MTDRSTYTLWCIDTGEDRYMGPYDSEDEAWARWRKEDSGRDDSTWKMRRCRRVGVESLDIAATSGDVSVGAWADWEDETVIISGDPDALRAELMAVLDKHLRVDAYICEGDDGETRA